MKTSKIRVREAMLFAGGSFSRERDNNFSAFVIRHGDELLLLDTGLGSQIAAQYGQDMPRWGRPFFRYEDPVAPARDQLAQAGLPPIRRILLSHGHWDHASGVEDFPGADVWLPAQELATLRAPQGGVGGAWPSQVSGKPASRASRVAGVRSRSATASSRLNSSAFMTVSLLAYNEAFVACSPGSVAHGIIRSASESRLLKLFPLRFPVCLLSAP